MTNFEGLKIMSMKSKHYVKKKKEHSYRFLLKEENVKPAKFVH